jgi:hypothetical protein
MNGCGFSVTMYEKRSAAVGSESVGRKRGSAVEKSDAGVREAESRHGTGRAAAVNKASELPARLLPLAVRLASLPRSGPENGSFGPLRFFGPHPPAAPYPEWPAFTVGP